MPAHQDLIHVSYCSRAHLPAGPEDLNRILQVSQRNNQRDQITGLLTYSGEVFVQFLEGPPEALRRLMLRIQGDPRHRDMIILSEGKDHDRVLPGWDMELVAREEAHQVLRAALSEADTYDKVIGLSSLLAKLKPDLHQPT